MPEERPAMPAELKRRVLVEAGHRCSIQTCRAIEIDVHHIIPYAECQKHEYENLLALCPNCHRRADRGDIDKKSLRMYKNNLRFLYDKFTTFEVDVLFELNKLSPDNVMLFPSFLVLLIKRIIEAGHVRHTPAPMPIRAGGMSISPDYLQITESGREFVNNLSEKDMGY